MYRNYISDSKFNDIMGRVASNDSTLTKLRFFTLNAKNSNPEEKADWTEDYDSEVHIHRINFIAQNLSYNTYIMELNFRGCHLRPKYISVLVDSIKFYSNIKSLNLYANIINEAVMIKNAISATEILYIHLNPMHEDEDNSNATRAIVNFIEQNNSLLSLNLGFSGISSEDAKLIFSALVNNRSLKEIILDSNFIGPDAILELCHLIQAGNMSFISLAHNQLDDSITTQMHRAIYYSQNSLRKLVLTGNPMFMENTQDHPDFLDFVNAGIEVETSGDAPEFCVIA
ncbi:MAG: hypothetical protein SFT68_00155 [Rickettsiaceae bacterium]|nr:hypothetical protein [Rickettsiaceae bacterium]